MLGGCSGVMIVIITCQMTDRVLEKLGSAVLRKILVALYLNNTHEYID